MGQEKVNIKGGGIMVSCCDNVIIKIINIMENIKSGIKMEN